MFEIKTLIGEERGLGVENDTVVEMEKIEEEEKIDVGKIEVGKIEEGDIEDGKTDGAVVEQEMIGFGEGQLSVLLG